MRELIGTAIVVLALFSVFGWSDVNLCMHTAEKDYCTKEFKPHPTQAAKQPSRESPSNEHGTRFRPACRMLGS